MPLNMHWKPIDKFSDFWSPTHFSGDELTRYAQRMTLEETRRGLRAMSLSVLLLLVAAAAMFSYLGFTVVYLYTCTLLALLSAHIYLSCGSIHEIRTLHLLGMTLLVVSGTALVLLAHQEGGFNMALIASVSLLFMVVPMMPWGLREALVITALIYGSLSSSTFMAARNFLPETMLTLQFVMVGAGLVSLALVARGTQVRRGEIRARFELEGMHDRLLHLSNRDPLTGAWNRRYLNNNFTPLVNGWQARGLNCHFAFLDVDNFKPFNDSYGHDYGDRVLKWLSDGFSAAVGDRGILIRMGGDEFALLFSGDDPEQIIEAGLAGLLANVELATTRSRSPVSLSVGMVSFSPVVAVDLTQLYKETDEALYKAKANKRNPERGTGYLVNRQLTAPKPRLLKAG